MAAANYAYGVYTGMNEASIGRDFTVAMAGLYIQAPQLKNGSGFPDRLVLLPDGRTVAVELKWIKVNLDNSFRFAGLRPDQCAWLAKWQHHGGLCFVFSGFYDSNSNFLGYSVIRMHDWKDWLSATKSNLNLNTLEWLSKDKSYIRKWFDDYTSSKMDEYFGKQLANA